MNDTLNQRYNRFYTPLFMAEPEQEIEDCHRNLIERLEKPERKLGAADHGCPESHHGGTFPGQFSLWV